MPVDAHKLLMLNLRLKPREFCGLLVKKLLSRWLLHYLDHLGLLKMYLLLLGVHLVEHNLLLGLLRHGLVLDKLLLADHASLVHYGLNNLWGLLAYLLLADNLLNVLRWLYLLHLPTLV